MANSLTAGGNNIAETFHGPGICHYHDISSGYVGLDNHPMASRPTTKASEKNFMQYILREILNIIEELTARQL